MWICFTHCGIKCYNVSAKYIMRKATPRHLKRDLWPRLVQQFIHHNDHLHMWWHAKLRSIAKYNIHVYYNAARMTNIFQILHLIFLGLFRNDATCYWGLYHFQVVMTSHQNLLAYTNYTLILLMTSITNIYEPDQLVKLEAVRSAYLWLCFLTFSYLSIPILTYPYLSLPFLTLFLIC